MNELLYNQSLNEKITVTKSEDDLITFSNGYKLSFYHDQDCCESVWADCQNINVGMELESIEIKKVDGMGVLLNGQLINCYNEQNGYYSDQLEMTLSDKDGNKLFYIDDVEKKDDIN